MDKDLLILYRKDQIQSQIAKLDRGQYHILYFSYYLNWHNLYHTPLLLATKLLALFTGKSSMDHVAHISRFVLDAEEGKYEAKIFEATVEQGMEENDLFDKLKHMQGTCYIEIMNFKLDKIKAQSFEDDYIALPYSKALAFQSGMDIKSLESHKKRNGGFCSWLETLSLSMQGCDLAKFLNKDALEITPSDIFTADLGEKKIFYKS